MSDRGFFGLGVTRRISLVSVGQGRGRSCRHGSCIHDGVCGRVKEGSEQRAYIPGYILVRQSSEGTDHLIVALRWIFSTCNAVFLCLGCQMTFPYSRCGRTRDMYSRGTVTSFRWVNVFLTRPSILEALLTADITCFWKVKSGSMMTPKSFSSACSWCRGDPGWLYRCPGLYPQSQL